MENVFWKPFIIFLSILGIPVNIIVFGILWRFNTLKPIIASPFWSCRWIEFGIIRWYDIPHLHSYIIHRRIDVEFQAEMKSAKTKQVRIDENE